MPVTPAFVEDLPEEAVQPYVALRQGPFVAVVQWDGTREFQHWVLVPVEKIEEFIGQLREAAK